MSLINSYLKQHQKEAKEKGMILIPNREMAIAQHIRECETLDEGTEYLYGVLINMKIGIEKRIEERTLTENEVSKYWYNKGHEDGRKLAVVNPLIEFDRKKCYRIGQEPKPDLVVFYNALDYGHMVRVSKHDNEANLKITWDGETRKLKSAEVIA